MKIQEVKITISPDGKMTLHFEGMKAKVRHSLAEELEKLIGRATERKHGVGDEEAKAHIHILRPNGQAP